MSGLDLAAPPFAGFTGAAFDFLRQLEANNADWFEPRKGEYERLCATR